MKKDFKNMKKDIAKIFRSIRRGSGRKFDKKQK